MFNLSPLTLRLAYREVKTEAELLAAWDAGKDFRIHPGGQLCSKRDLHKGLTDGASSIWLMSYYRENPAAVGPLATVTVKAWDCRTDA